MKKFYIKIFKITCFKFELHLSSKKKKKKNFELHETIFVVSYKVEPVNGLNLVPKMLKGEQFYPSVWGHSILDP